MKALRILLAAVTLAILGSSTALAIEERYEAPIKGKTLLMMIDTIYGDFTKCTEVPKAAITKKAETILLLPMIGPFKGAYSRDRGKIDEQFSGDKKKMLCQAFGIAYFVLSVLVSIAMLSVFMWLGAGIAGEREKSGNFRKALMASFFDRVTIALLVVGIGFGLAHLVGDQLQGVVGNVVVPVVLLVLFFILSTAIVKMVYNLKWTKALLIQICTRVAVGLVAVFILGFASAVSLAST